MSDNFLIGFITVLLIVMIIPLLWCIKGSARYTSIFRSTDEYKSKMDYTAGYMYINTGAVMAIFVILILAMSLIACISDVSDKKVSKLEKQIEVLEKENDSENETIQMIEKKLEVLEPQIHNNSINTEQLYLELDEMKDQLGIPHERVD